MRSHNPYRKIDVTKEEVRKLLVKNPKFKRMYDEYDHLSDHLWDLEQIEGESITDEFLNYIKVETSSLENELEDFIATKTS